MMTEPCVRPLLLLVTSLPPAMRERLKLQFDLYDDAALDEKRRAALPDPVRAMLCNAQSIINRQQMLKWPQLELIVVIGVGMDGIDLEAAAELGIAVHNTPDVSTDDIADHTLALLLASAKQIVRADQFVRQGDWLQGRFSPALRVSGQRLGIVGLGRIGRAVARRAQAFDMSIAYTGRTPKSDVSYRWFDSVKELAAQVDFLVVCASGGSATQGLIDAEVLQALGPQGVLVNIGRGSIVDEEALQHALQARTIAAAALDVFAREPFVPLALRDSTFMVLTPHMASSTVQGLQAMLQAAESLLREHFALSEPVAEPDQVSP